MFAVETIKNEYFRGEILNVDGTFAKNSEDIEKTLRDQGYIVVFSTNQEHDNARIPAERVKGYAQFREDFREDYLYKLDEELPF